MQANERLNSLLDDSFQPSFVRNTNAILAFLTEQCDCGAVTMTKMDMAAKTGIPYYSFCTAMKFLQDNAIIETEKARNIVTKIGVNGNWTRPMGAGDNWGDGYNDCPIEKEKGSRKLCNAILEYLWKHDKKIRGALNG